MKKNTKMFISIIIILVALVIIVFCYFFVGKAPVREKINWGIDFSQMQAENLKLNWKETYLAIINDLGAKDIKLHTQWDWIEGEKDEYFFDDIDWQIKQAEKKNVKIIYVVGLKTGRWPECHIPEWANNLPEQQQKDAILNYIKETVQRYKNNNAITYWQVENEPLFNFGECPSWYYKDDSFLKREVDLVKSLDPSRQVIVSDSGELSLWLNASKIGDVLGATMYRRAWVNISSFGLNIPFRGFYGNYLMPPIFYWRKAGIIKYIFNKKVICVELQAEPWAQKPFYDVPLEEQYKTMDLQKFRDNIKYAKETGLDTFYFWGVEWWYWMKTKQNQPEIWSEAQNLFNN